MGRILAFIPCRVTSRRFPGKNLQPFQGEPLVVHAVRRALEAKAIGLVDDVVVSQDSSKVRSALMDGGVFGNITADDRPPEMQGEHIRVIDLLLDILQQLLLAPSDRRHALRLLEPPSVVCVLLPTSPLRTLRHLVESYRLFTEDVAAVLSVTPFRQDVLGALALDSIDVSDQVIRMADTWAKGPYYKHDGTVAWLRAVNVLNGLGFYSGTVQGYHVPPEESADIDTELDLYLAEALARRKVKE